MGERLAGSYALRCADAEAPAATPVDVRITVTAEGDFRVQGALGNFVLPAGGSTARLDENATALTATRSGQVVAAVAESFAARPVTDGLVIGIGNEPPDIDFVIPRIATVSLGTAGASVYVDFNEYTCNGALPDADTLTPGLRTPERTGTWLPDDTYQCEDMQNDGALRAVTLSDGILYVSSPASAPGASLAATVAMETEDVFQLDAFVTAAEVQEDPLGAPEASTADHAHTDDDVAATLYPRSFLTLQGYPAALFSARLTVYRSQVNGRGYFDLFAGGHMLSHCQAAPAP
jgi:hypothetical protein